MDIRKRVVSCRLLEKLKRDSEYANLLGVNGKLTRIIISKTNGRNAKKGGIKG